MVLINVSNSNKYYYCDNIHCHIHNLCKNRKVVVCIITSDDVMSLVKIIYLLVLLITDHVLYYDLV